MPAFIFQVLNPGCRCRHPIGLEVEATVTNRGTPKSRRWLRHWLLALSPSGIHPLPLDLWFTLPEKGCVDPVRMVRFYLPKISAKALSMSYALLI